MAASNYSVNIKLNTKPARVQLEALERRVNKLRASLNNPLRIESKATLIKKQQVALEDMMHRTRRLGDQIRKFEEQGIKLDKLRLELKSAARNTDKGRFQTAKDAQKFVAEELKALEKQLEANIKNAGVDRDRVFTFKNFNDPNFNRLSLRRPVQGVIDLSPGSPGRRLAEGKFTFRAKGGYIDLRRKAG